MSHQEKALILLVDDIPANLQVLGHLLRDEEKYSLAIATNGSNAISLAKKHKPDLILLDIMMPDINGYDVCRQLKSDNDTKEIPVIFLTAKTQSDDIVKGFEVGAVDYLTKPFNKYELFARVKTHLKLKKSIEELNQSTKELEKNNKQKDKFFSILAHDLRNPINSQLGLSHLMIDQFDSFTHDELKENLQHIFSSAKSMSNLLDNMLTWARTQMGKIQYMPVLEDISLLIKETIKSLLPIAENKNISLQMENEVVSNIELDIHMISTVLRNLITNAIKFTHPGGKVLINYQIDHKELKVEVKDNGIGISEDNMKKLFNLESQLKTNGTADEKGTGLGLLLCKEFIDLHKGSIGATSELDKGSCFYFTLP
ncbi:MAG TPA: hybrid sensor histidine kinase/response regulator, partial [Candidatus Cloacimonadota bacterium]|nr:hybrid sensor histidine kinase/response regulator [Candidatus Cloacimonadota bacterium]